jgi:hypothetical protein
MCLGASVVRSGATTSGGLGTSVGGTLFTIATAAPIAKPAIATAIIARLRVSATPHATRAEDRSRR